MSERKPDRPSARACRPATPRAPERPYAREAGPRRTQQVRRRPDGWDAYNDWLDRVRQPAPPSRQAVITKSLYSVASYKTWADKARDAFDKSK